VAADAEIVAEIGQS